MSLMVQGKMNKEIASALEVSIRTIEVHRSKVMQKMNAQSLPDLVRVADLCDSSLLRK
jgi:FixJ family two-component response regulator